MEYLELLDNVLTNGVEEFNQRTGLNTKTLLAQTVELKGLRIFTPRKFSPVIASSEVCWELSGEQSTEWLDKKTKIWKKFQEPDGFIEGAYGYRWRYRYGRDQIQEAIDLLKKDSSSRQVLISAWDPRIDGLRNQGKVKNVACPFSFSLYILKGSLNLIVYQRSADLILGLAYDIPSYYILGQAFANSIGVPFAGVEFLLGNVHIYENLYDVAKEMNTSELPRYSHNLQHNYTIDEITSAPDDFVDLYKGLYSHVIWPVETQLEATQ